MAREAAQLLEVRVVELRSGCEEPQAILRAEKPLKHTKSTRFHAISCHFMPFRAPKGACKSSKFESKGRLLKLFERRRPRSACRCRRR